MNVIGLDVGTSRVKAVRFDDALAAVDGESAETTVRHGADGAREQSMPQVWEAAVDVLGAVVRRSPEPIDLVAVTAQGDGCWLVDDDAQPVADAMLWNDSRAGGIVADWNDDGTAEKTFQISGCSAAPGLANAELRWLAQHRPEVLDRAATLLSCGSWIYANLTGRLALEQTDAANPFFDAAYRRYEPALLDMFGIADHARLLPPVVHGAERVTPLSATAAERIGLRSGIPVVLSPYDVASTAIGTGAVSPGQAFAVLGTTLCIGTVHDDPRRSRPPNGLTLPGVTDDRWLIAYATMTGTEVLDWAAALLGVPDAAAVADLADTSRHAAPPVLLPYLSPAGERSPFLDPAVRGTLTGLELSHRPADVARGVLDGLTLAVLDCVHAAGGTESLALSGGGARSAPWCQAISDATGIPVIRPDVDEVGARGAVISALCDVNAVDDVDAAVSRFVRPGVVHEPEPGRTERYREQYARFVQHRDALRERHDGDARPAR